RSALRSFISCPSSLPSSIFSLPFYCSCPLPALHSFPTRRSSDLLTSLQLAARLAATGRGLRDLAAVMTRLPQVLVNVPGVDKSRVDSDDELAAAVAAAEARLGGSGRVLLRSSGTEPLVRVMVEAATQDQAEREAGGLSEVVRNRLALA